MPGSMPSPMQCSDLAATVEREGLSPLPADALAHLEQCDDCQGFLADLGSIVSVAHQLPAEVEPPPRIWTSLRAQLTAEGIIRDLTPAQPEIAHHTSWWHAFAGLFHGRALATAAVGLVIMVAAIVQLRKPADSAPPPPATESAPLPDPLAASGAALTEQEHILRSAQPAGTLASSPVDDSLQQDLVTLDAFIADCEHHLKTNPRDQLAREYLAGAYQQKAELLSEMLDRGRSVN
jgi:hypothetical protein